MGLTHQQTDLVSTAKVDFFDELGGSCLSAEHHQSFV